MTGCIPGYGCAPLQAFMLAGGTTPRTTAAGTPLWATPAATPSASPTRTATASSFSTAITAAACGSVSFTGQPGTELVGPLGFPALGATDFTIEWWAFQTSAVPPVQRLFAYLTPGASSWGNNWVAVSIQSGYPWLWVGATGLYTDAAFPTKPNLGAWLHWAVVRSAGTVSLYIDGVLAAALSGGSGDYGDSLSSFHIGGNDPSWAGSQFAGEMTDFRIVAGQALHT